MNGFGRKGSAVIAGSLAAVVVVALGITASSAAYTDQEFDKATVGTLDCDVPGEFNTQAWGQVVSAELLGGAAGPDRRARWPHGHEPRDRAGQRSSAE